MKQPPRKPAPWTLQRQRFIVSPTRHPTTQVVTSWSCRAHFHWNLLRGRFDGRAPVTYVLVTTKGGYTSHRLPEHGHEVGFAEACSLCPNQNACRRRDSLEEFWLPPP